MIGDELLLTNFVILINISFVDVFISSTNWGTFTYRASALEGDDIFYCIPRG